MAGQPLRWSLRNIWIFLALLLALTALAVPALLAAPPLVMVLAGVLAAGFALLAGAVLVWSYLPHFPERVRNWKRWLTVLGVIGVGVGGGGLLLWGLLR